MKKGLIIGSIIFIVGIISFYAFITLTKETVTIKETTSENGEVGGKIIEIIEKEGIPVEQEFPDSINEDAVRDAIHGMSHQKVEAEDKWGFRPLTAERVHRLITVVATNETDYEKADIYLDILNRWSKNDFSQVDRDHNAIWKLQNGNIGKATGILSVEEEIAFIEEHFDVE
jgi:hypothetical protein